jgi:DNA-binding NtrC family response regulator
MSPSQAQKTILVVDDEPEVRKLVGAMVTHYGYRVLTADSGEHALTLFKKNKPIDLLLTDVVAPGMSGPMLADKLTAMQPGLKVLFMSGYLNTHVVKHYVVEKGYSLLTKPFDLETLGARVQQLLAETGSVKAPEAAAG